MNFEQLAYVKKLYELESMIQASESIHISQSAMSQSLRKPFNTVYIRDIRG